MERSICNESHKLFSASALLKVIEDVSISLKYIVAIIEANTIIIHHNDFFVLLSIFLLFRVTKNEYPNNINNAIPLTPTTNLLLAKYTVANKLSVNKIMKN